MSSYGKSGQMLVLHFGKHSGGNVAVIFALLLLPILSSVGAAIEYSQGNSIKAAMQAATDATALALAKSAGTLSSTDLTQQANNQLRAQFKRPEADLREITAQYSTQDNSVMVSSAATMKTALLKVVGLSTLKISATATAKPAGGGKVCVLALSRLASGSISTHGTADLNLDGCSIYDNSSNSTALTVGGSGKISALSVGVAGGISGASAIVTTQGVLTGLAPIPDPYANVAVPAFSGCRQNNFSTKETVTINPGVYCGGMQIGAGAVVTLTPGIYYIDGGEFSIKGGGTITGVGVTLIFTSSTMTNWPTASINGNATVSLTPPVSGPTAGIVMFGDRNMPVGTSFNLNGGTSQYLGGAIYFPSGALTFGGGTATSTTCTQLIADTIEFVGNAGLAINCKDYSTRAVGPGGVRLVS
jgi:Flp pilus assembly protein TadG